LKIVFDLFDKIHSDPSKPKLLKDLEFYHRKIVLKLFRKNVHSSLITILARFFTLTDEIESVKVPSNEMLKYHLLLTTEIYDMIENPFSKDYDSELFLLFLQYNFNKPNITDYYCELIKTLQAKNDQKAKTYIDLIDLAESEYKIEHSYCQDKESLSNRILMTYTIALNPNQPKVISIF